MKLVIDISEKDYLECVKRVEEIRDKGYMIENLKYKIIIADGTPLWEELEKIRAEIDTARFIDKDTKLCKNANASGLEVAMQIIDKNKAESEPEGDAE